MVTEEEYELIEQVTLHKLDFTRELLRANDLPFSGTRNVVREICRRGIEEQKLDKTKLQTLLTPLEMWGHQRIRLVLFQDFNPRSFRDKESIFEQVRLAGMENCWESNLPLILPDVIKPLSIRYSDENRKLTIVAGKMREFWIPLSDIEDRKDETNPEIIFRPFKKERQKAISFLELDLDSGHGILSTKLFRHGMSYRAEFAEFYQCLTPLIHLSNSLTLDLYRAVYKLYYVVGEDEARIQIQSVRDDIGGILATKSHSKKADVRQHNRLHTAMQTLGADTPGDSCNCNWLVCDGLNEEVHTHLHGPTGEISFFGQVREESVRYVLQRIRRFNQ